MVASSCGPRTTTAAFGPLRAVAARSRGQLHGVQMDAAADAVARMKQMMEQAEMVEGLEKAVATVRAEAARVLAVMASAREAAVAVR